ncbi:50S ribosomal protein L22 [Ktedonosporobacter rubrisoli]|uniref:Large ribosomal subunit protein uL22 n=1 Tax=Ktedonosporobacter rubrisoli TaxID=2509675 RepID=A0A4P6JXF4_KTERU|nr:50S ribosomal protein L22 [Ktedonosporobacter rubrisoli]QBD80093.1 50S ribosomal protein L22 [Ktedonosporobacter rubrisoli]
MQVRAIAKNIGVSPRKMRLVTNAVKGLRVNEALAVLQFLPQAGATPVRKVVASASANAENNYNLNPDDLYILNIVADDSFRIKRVKPRSHGRAARILRRFCHVTVVVSDDPADAGR